MYVHVYVLFQIEVILTKPEQKAVMCSHVDQLLRAVLMKMKANFSAPLANADSLEARNKVTVMLYLYVYSGTSALFALLWGHHWAKKKKCPH